MGGSGSGNSTAGGAGASGTVSFQRRQTSVYPLIHRFRPLEALARLLPPENPKAVPQQQAAQKRLRRLVREELAKPQLRQAPTPILITSLQRASSVSLVSPRWSSYKHGKGDLLPLV